MTIVRVVEYTDLDGENHTKDFEKKLIGRLTADPELKYTKKTNKALCNVVLAVNSIYSNEAEYLHLVFWNKTAENLCKYKGKGDLIAVRDSR